MIAAHLAPYEASVIAMNMTLSSIFAGLALCLSLNNSAAGQGLKVDPRLKASKVAYAGMQSVIKFTQVFEKAHGHLPQKEFVGFHMATNSQVKYFDAGLYHIVEAGQLATDLYNCYFHISNSDIKSAHCRDENVRDVKEYKAAPRQFKIAQFQPALIAMLDYFKQKHGKPSAIREIKMWHGDKNLEFRVNFVQGDDNSKMYIKCQPRGGAASCQSRSQPGSHEPVDF